MSVKLRMKRMGTKKRPFFRVVVIDSRRARDGRFLDIVGYYNPMAEPAQIKIDEDKVYAWLRNGAIPSPKVRELFRKVGLLEKWTFVRQGVPIGELQSKIEERRAKQPARSEKTQPKKRLSKKQAAKAAASSEGEPKADAGKQG